MGSFAASGLLWKSCQMLQLYAPLCPAHLLDDVEPVHGLVQPNAEGLPEGPDVEVLGQVLEDPIRNSLCYKASKCAPINKLQSEQSR